MSDKQRVQLDMLTNTVKLLDKIKNQIDASSRTEVIKNALIHYWKLIDSVLNNKKIIIRDKDNNEEELFIAIIKK